MCDVINCILVLAKIRMYDFSKAILPDKLKLYTSDNVLGSYKVLTCLDKSLLKKPHILFANSHDKYI